MKIKSTSKVMTELMVLFPPAGKVSAGDSGLAQEKIMKPIRELSAGVLATSVRLTSAAAAAVETWMQTQATLLTGESTDSRNHTGYPDRVAPKKTELTFKQGTATLPPHSPTIVHVGAA